MRSRGLETIVLAGLTGAASYFLADLVGYNVFVIWAALMWVAMLLVAPLWDALWDASGKFGVMGWKERAREGVNGTLMMLLALGVVVWIGFVLWTWVNEPFCLLERKLGIDC